MRVVRTRSFRIMMIIAGARLIGAAVGGRPSFRKTEHTAGRTHNIITIIFLRRNNLQCILYCYGSVL